MSCCFLDWSAALDTDGIAPLTSLLNDEIDADLIIGADIVSPRISFFAHRDGPPCFQVFDPDLIPPLVAVLRLALQANSRPRSALIALTTRNPTTMEKFTDAVRGTSLPHVLVLKLIFSADSGLVLGKVEFQEDIMFMESLERGGDANSRVNIFSISSKLQ